MVVTEVDKSEVLAYYGWSMATVLTADVPERFREGAGRYPQPVAFLARLGVSVEHEGRGLGVGLLGDIIGRTAQLGIETGCRGLLVQAESAGVRDFYLHLVPEFGLLPTDDLYLVLLMKDILKTFTG